MYIFQNNLNATVSTLQTLTDDLKVQFIFCR